ncbi:class A beta-lactamase [Caballeronia sp. LjRoot31]|uniref:class A beta-lactamase n=1 Tax=Caballeronia sp. LjRoot31 TaxID=3342324 RepID=UPI003ED00E8D
MKISATRRNLIIGFPLLLGISGKTTRLLAAESPFADIERRYGGRLGIFAVDTESGRTLVYRADEHFLMCSTFKGLLIALVLSRVDAGQESLARPLRYTEKDLIFTSPVTKANVAQGEMTVGALCQATVELSDNTAAVLLMSSVGGASGADPIHATSRGHRDSFRSVRTQVERIQRVARHHNAESHHDIGKNILLGDVLSLQSRQQLEDWMIACRPGLNRLRAVFPADWLAGDRPGTSVGAETNDYAFVRPPGRAPLLIAAYYDAPALDMGHRDAVLREAGHIFVQWANATA